MSFSRFYRFLEIFRNVSSLFFLLLLFPIFLKDFFSFVFYPTFFLFFPQNLLLFFFVNFAILQPILLLLLFFPVFIVFWKLFRMFLLCSSLLFSSFSEGFILRLLPGFFSFSLKICCCFVFCFF